MHSFSDRKSSCETLWIHLLLRPGRKTTPKIDVETQMKSRPRADTVQRPRKLCWPLSNTFQRAAFGYLSEAAKAVLVAFGNLSEGAKAFLAAFGNLSEAAKAVLVAFGHLPKSEQPKELSLTTKLSKPHAGSLDVLMRHLSTPRRGRKTNVESNVKSESLKTTPKGSSGTPFQERENLDNNEKAGILDGQLLKIGRAEPPQSTLSRKCQPKKPNSNLKLRRALFLRALAILPHWQIGEMLAFGKTGSAATLNFRIGAALQLSDQVVRKSANPPTKISHEHHLTHTNSTS